MTWPWVERLFPFTFAPMERGRLQDIGVEPLSQISRPAVLQSQPVKVRACEFVCVESLSADSHPFGHYRLVRSRPPGTQGGEES